VTILPKPERKGPKLSPYLRPISHLFITGELFQKAILKIVQKKVERKMWLTYTSQHDISMYEEYRTHDLEFQ
jgi:hypothetical protein